jgi:hypothetical protein
MSLNAAAFTGPGWNPVLQQLVAFASSPPRGTIAIVICPDLGTTVPPACTTAIDDGVPLAPGISDPSPTFPYMGSLGPTHRWKHGLHLRRTAG